MKSLLINLIFLYSLTSLGQTTWTSKENFPGTSRKCSSSFTANNKVYLVGGLISTTESTKENWEYDPASDEWVEKEIFTGDARWDAFSFAIGEKGYVGGGVIGGNNSSQFTATVYEYNTATDTWDNVQGLPANRRQATGFAINGKGYVAWGYYGPNSSQKDASVLEYDPVLDSWTAMAPIPDIVDNAVVLDLPAPVYVDDDNAFLTGGNYPYGETWKFNPTNDSWTPVDTPSLRPYASFEVGGQGYLVAYENNSGWQGHIMKMDESLGEWVEFSDLPNDFNPIYGGELLANNPCGTIPLIMQSTNGVNKQFIADFFSATGPTLLCTSDQGTYTLSNVPAGASVSWIKSSNLTIISQSGNSLTVQAPSTNGTTGWVRPTITGTCGDVELGSQTVWIQNSATLTYQGAGVECMVPEKSYSFTPAIPAMSDVIQQVSINTNKLDAYIENGSVYVVNNSVSPGSSQSFTITLSLTDNNGCAITGTRTGVFYQPTPCNCGYDDPSCNGGGGPGGPLLVFPNPTEDEVTIEHKEKNDFDVWVYDFSNNLILSGTSKQGQLKKVLSGFGPGTYIILIETLDGKRYQTKVVKN